MGDKQWIFRPLTDIHDGGNFANQPLFCAAAISRALPLRLDVLTVPYEHPSVLSLHLTPVLRHSLQSHGEMEYKRHLFCKISSIKVKRACSAAEIPL